nr:hypothetical protein [Tanacetum cinerariifolium]
MGIEKVRVHMKDGSSFVLENVRYILEFKRNLEFNNLCKESGIARHLTVAGTSQHYGLAERMNRTLMNKVRCLLIQSGLPDSFWAEATVTASYLINRSPSTSLEKKTPYGFMGKLKPRAIKCIFLRYPDGYSQGAGAADYDKEVEFKVELQGSRVETIVDPHTAENPGNEDEEQDEEPQK